MGDLCCICGGGSSDQQTNESLYVVVATGYGDECDGLVSDDTCTQTCVDGYSNQADTSGFITCVAGEIDLSQQIVCEDVHECDLDISDCAEVGSVCINEIGGHSCECAIGYEGDGYSGEDNSGCTPILCQEDQYVQGHFCVPCSEIGDGWINEAGDDASGEDTYCDLYDCIDSIACNFNEIATIDDGTCTYATEFYDCDGVCLNDADGDGVCDELEIEGCMDELVDNAFGGCNYSPEATDDDGSCTYAETYYDCDGVCLNDDDLNGVCNEFQPVLIEDSVIIFTSDDPMDDIDVETLRVVYCNVVMSLSGLGEDQVDCGIEESNTRRLLYAIYILSTYASPLSQANMTALPDPANLEAAVIETLVATTDMQVSEDGHFADPDSGGGGGASS